MTLRKLTLHKDILKSEKIQGQKVVETKIAKTGRWDPAVEKSGFYSPHEANAKLTAMEEHSYEKPSHYDPNKLARIPQGRDDSRSLLEAKFSLSIEVENQSQIKQSLVELYNDAMTTSDSKMNSEVDDKGRVRFFNGLKEALFTAKRDVYMENEGIKEDVCLYFLSSKYDAISNTFHQFIDDEIFSNSEETNYSESYHLGVASGYKNVSEMIKNKLARAENERYRAYINPSQ